MDKLIVTFYSVSSALYLEKLLAGGDGTSCKVVPVPRALSSSCGYAAIVQGMQKDALRQRMDAEDVEWEAVYRCIPKGGDEVYEALENH